MQIHTDTYTYAPPQNRVGWGFSGGAASACDPVARRHPARSSRMLLEAGSQHAHGSWEAYWGHQGLALPPPDASCALGCAKTGPGVGPRWRSKVVGHLPRVALSGAC